MTRKLEFGLERVGDIVGKGEKFPTMSSKGLILGVVKTQDCFGKG